MTNQPTQPIRAVIGQYAAQVQPSPCPWCRSRDWDDGVATLAPIIPDTGSFNADAPYQHNALLVTIVFTCQQCHYALTFSPGGWAAPKAP
jgi:hypothetical protein